MAVSLTCPYCKHEIGLKARVPGQYGPICPNCEKKFVFTVPENADDPILISPLKTQLATPVVTREERLRHKKEELERRKQLAAKSARKTAGKTAQPASPVEDEPADAETPDEAPVAMGRKTLSGKLSFEEVPEDDAESTSPSVSRPKSTGKPAGKSDTKAVAPTAKAKKPPAEPAEEDADDGIEITLPTALQRKPAPAPTAKAPAKPASHDEEDAGGLEEDDGIEITLPSALQRKPASAKALSPDPDDPDSDEPVADEPALAASKGGAKSRFSLDEEDEQDNALSVEGSEEEEDLIQAAPSSSSKSPKRQPQPAPEDLDIEAETPEAGDEPSEEEDLERTAPQFRAKQPAPASPKAKPIPADEGLELDLDEKPEQDEGESTSLSINRKKPPAAAPPAPVVAKPVAKPVSKPAATPPAKPPAKTAGDIEDDLELDLGDAGGAEPAGNKADDAEATSPSFARKKPASPVPAKPATPSSSKAQSKAPGKAMDTDDLDLDLGEEAAAQEDVEATAPSAIARKPGPKAPPSTPEKRAAPQARKPSEDEEDVGATIPARKAGRSASDEGELEATAVSGSKRGPAAGAAKRGNSPASRAEQDIDSTLPSAAPGASPKGKAGRTAPPAHSAAASDEESELDVTALSGAEMADSAEDHDATGVSDLKQGGQGKGLVNEARKRYKDAVAAGGKVEKGEKPAPADDVPSRLGGYEIVDVLGKGGMGAVYKARQVSLDREVAVKVMHAQWARDPQFVSRFVREAYAAAQLVHHNVVQIYDIGEQQGIHFFSMEFVQGDSLKGLVKKQGKLEPEVAAGYILQAARGLKFAHDRGMIHRDIKPDNLMLNLEGIVKVADLGLVKTPGATETVAQKRSDMLRKMSAEVTSASVAMGTPAYMAPEQAEDAANVDLRADIYSLGCSFYVLLCGKPPFEGKTAAEVLTKHATEAMIPPDVIVKRVPKSLTAVVERMVAKNPADRYPTLDPLIADLEAFLGVDSAAPFSPKEQHVSRLEEAVEQYNSSRMARLRKMSILGFFGFCALAVIVCAFFLSKPSLAGGFLGMGVLTSVSYFALSGIFNQSYLFGKVRQLLFGASIKDWLTWLVGLAAIVGLLHVFNLLMTWLVFCVVSAALAFVMATVVDRMVKKELEAPLEETRDLLKALRLFGLEEERVRHFVCRFAGPRWEPIYEGLFGYEDKIAARNKWGLGDDGSMRPKFRGWRDGIVEAIDARLAARKEARERRHLERIERQSLKAQGIDEAEAARKAKAVAQNMVAGALAMQEEAKRITQEAATMISQARSKTERLDSDVAVKHKVMSVKAMVEAQPEDNDAEAKHRERQRASAAYGEAWGPLGLILGPKARFLLAIALLGLCALWMKQNNMIPTAEAAQAKGVSALWDFKGSKPLNLPLVPDGIIPMQVRNGLLNSYNMGIAGLIFLLSVVARRRRITWLSWPAVFVTVGVPVGMQFASTSAAWTARDMLAAAVGAGLAFLGLIWKR